MEIIFHEAFVKPKIPKNPNCLYVLNIYLIANIETVTHI